jgi:hypothetical protein
MRAADALEKATRDRGDLLSHHKRAILGPMGDVEQQEVRWHWAQIVSRLDLTSREMQSVVSKLEALLNDPSRIVRVQSLQALADLAARFPQVRARVSSALASANQSESPAVRARARKLLKHAKSAEKT